MAIPELPAKVLPSWDRSKEFFAENLQHLRSSSQQSREFFRESALEAMDSVTQVSGSFVDLKVRAARRVTQATDLLTSKTQKAVETMTTATGDSVKSMTDAYRDVSEAITQTKNTASDAMQTAFAASVSDWLQAHPVAFRLVQMILWGVNHPIWSLIILLFAIALALIIIKAIGRLIEFASLSILRVPLKLIQGFFKVSFISFSQISNLASTQLFGAKIIDNILPPTTIPQVEKPQRLAEISTRLAALQHEQNQLLEEIAVLMTADKSDV